MLLKANDSEHMDRVFLSSMKKFKFGSITFNYSDVSKLYYYNKSDIFWLF